MDFVINVSRFILRIGRRHRCKTTGQPGSTRYRHIHRRSFPFSAVRIYRRFRERKIIPIVRQRFSWINHSAKFDFSSPDRIVREPAANAPAPHKPASIRAVALILSPDGPRRPRCLSSAAAPAQDRRNIRDDAGVQNTLRYRWNGPVIRRRSFSSNHPRSGQGIPVTGSNPNTGDPLPARLTWTYFSVP